MLVMVLWGNPQAKDLEDLQLNCRYKYYNWRKDTSSDLLLIVVMNALLLLGGTAVKTAFVDPQLVGTGSDAPELAAQSSEESHSTLSWVERLWPDIYQVLLLTLGENFPGVAETWKFQVYSIGMSLLGVIGFALLLALTEQILLEVLDSNVRQGTQVFEEGHILVVAECKAGKDMETLWRVLSQVGLVLQLS
jgi:hypothetical protein